MTFWNIDRIQINLPFFHFLFFTFFSLRWKDESLTNHQIRKAEDDDSFICSNQGLSKNQSGAEIHEPIEIKLD